MAEGICSVANRARYDPFTSLNIISSGYRDTINENPNAFVAKKLKERRVCAGSTYKVHPLPSFSIASQAALREEARTKEMIRQRSKGYCTCWNVLIPKKKVPPEEEVDLYLEDIDRELETETHCQSDLFKEREPEPMYIPPYIPADQATQIYSGDLFDFDVEVTPVLEILVGKTIEQAMMEVIEEDEIKTQEYQQRKFFERRYAELAENQRLEEQHRRLTEEKNQRMLNHEEGLRIQKEMEKKIAEAMLSAGYIENLLPHILEGLKEVGFSVEERKKDLDKNFMPWLSEEVREELKKMLSSGDILNELLKDVIECRHDIYTLLGDEFHTFSEEQEVFLGEADLICTRIDDI